MPSAESSKPQQWSTDTIVKASSHDPRNAITLLRQKVSTITDPKERERIVKEAYNKELEAHGDSKFARMIRSGAWQGLFAGGGIGAGVGVGVGTVVGTVVGGVVSIPTTALGGLIGSGVGALHGPWITLPKAQVPVKDNVEAAAPEAEVVVSPDVQRESATSTPAHSIETEESAKPAPARKRPRKLEIRASEQATSQHEDSGRKPKKLEVRSQREASA
jgi:hypothetical protein